MNEDIVKAVEIVVAKEIAKATAHTLAELARIQAERDRWIAAASTAIGERDQLLAERDSERDDARAHSARALDSLNAAWARLSMNISERKVLIEAALFTQFATKIGAVIDAHGTTIVEPFLTKFIKDIAANVTQAAFMLNESEPAEAATVPSADIRTAGHSPRVVIDTVGSAPRVEACTCGLRFVSQNPDDEYAAHVAAVTGIGKIVAPSEAP